jgi:hypothetical protein
MWSLAELPNSWAKRRSGVRPGEVAGYTQALVDHCDSCAGLVAYLALVHGLPLAEMAPLMPAAVLGHFAVSAARTIGNAPSATRI